MTACASNYVARLVYPTTPDTAGSDQDSKGATAVAPTPTTAPTPKPAPTSSSSNFDADRVAQLYRFPDIFARKALAEIYDVNPNGVTMRMLERAYVGAILALPYIYTMHMFASGGPESGHPLVNVDRFVIAYFKDVRHFAHVASEWLNGYLANPCTASELAREWVKAVEEAAPGKLNVLIFQAVQGNVPIAQYVVNAVYERAEQALYDNPNRYRCTRG